MKVHGILEVLTMMGNFSQSTRKEETRRRWENVTNVKVKLKHCMMTWTLSAQDIDDWRADEHGNEPSVFTKGME
jgi:hypothetical protein